jgi:poly [ADP-ribose] polymerase
MPPKTGGRAAKKEKEKARTVPPLHGCTIALSGTFPGRAQSALEQEFINALGASLAKTVNNSTTHLVTTDIDFAKPSAKVKQAQSLDVRIVKLAWLDDCLGQATRLSEDAYSFDAPDPVPDPPTVIANGKASGSRKRTVATSDDAEEDESQSQPKKKSKATSTNGSNIQSQEAPKSASANGAKPEPRTIAESKLKTEVADGQTNIAKSSDINIPLDETCPLTNYQIYIDNGGVIHDASLNQTNASNNNNKFYRLQVWDKSGSAS